MKVDTKIILLIITMAELFILKEMIGGVILWVLYGIYKSEHK